MARIYFASLLLVLAGIDAQLCGKDLDNYSHRELSDCDYERMKGKWYVLGYYDSENTLLKNTKCISYDYNSYSNGEFDITKYEQFKNGTNVEIKQKIKFEGTTNDFDYSLDIDDPNGYNFKSIVADFDVNNGNPDNQYLIYYSCTPKKDGKNWVWFMLLTRQFARIPNLYVSGNELIVKHELKITLKLLKIFGNPQCEKEKE